MRSFVELAQMAAEHPVYGLPDRERGGFFRLGMLRIIASWDNGWDHVSVSLRHRTPTWEEMERVKRAFFRDDETAMQLHVPPADHVNCHPHCLHLWRPHFAPLPRPAAWMVGGGDANAPS